MTVDSKRDTARHHADQIADVDDGSTLPVSFDEGDRLEDTIARIDAVLESPVSFPDEQVHSGAAALALIRIMLAHARAIATLSSTDYAETASANVRAMFEAWIDIYSMLEPGAEEANGRRCIVFGLLEFRDHSAKTGRLDANELARIDAMILPYLEKFPALVADVELQRSQGDRRNSNYWSGTSRSELIRRMEVNGVGATLRSVYKMLSWDAHHSIVVALRTSITTTTEQEIDVGFHSLQTPKEAALVNRFVAVQMLVKAWWQVTQHLSLDPG